MCDVMHSHIDYCRCEAANGCNIIMLCWCRRVVKPTLEQNCVLIYCTYCCTADKGELITFARQIRYFLPRDAMRKRRTVVCPFVCLSVCHVGGLYPDSWRCRQTSFSTRYSCHSSFFLTQSAGTNSKENPFSEGAKYMGWRNLAIFNWNPCYLGNGTR